MKEDDIPLSEIEKCLERSGYLLESRLVRSLTDRHYFVEPNQVIRDPRTGKSREIDLVAQHFQSEQQSKLITSTHFVIEAINNKFPFVLMTERPNSPGANFEGYVQFSCTPEPNPFLDSIDIYDEKGPSWENLFSQYCVLSRKKKGEQLMASHPDDVYGSILKLCEYVDDELSNSRARFSQFNDDCCRFFTWHPMLVLSGRLLTVKFGADGTPELSEADAQFLEFNWHAGEENKTTAIEVVTEQRFLQRVESIKRKDMELGERMSQFRKS